MFLSEKIYGTLGVVACLSTGRAYFSLGLYDEAKAYYRYILETRSDGFTSSLARGDILLLEQMRKRRARFSWREFNDFFTKGFVLAEKNKQQADPIIDEQTLGLFREAAQYHPFDMWNNYLIAGTLTNLGRLDEAMCVYSQVSKMDPIGEIGKQAMSMIRNIN
jgi:tetratricopeptide (TPR) repeat protein